MQPLVSVQILVRGLADGWFTGKKLSDYITFEKSDFTGERRVINGTDEAASIAAIARDYDTALKKAGHSIEADKPELTT